MVKQGFLRYRSKAKATRALNRKKKAGYKVHKSRRGGYYAFSYWKA